MHKSQQNEFHARFRFLSCFVALEFSAIVSLILFSIQQGEHLGAMKSTWYIVRGTAKKKRRPAPSADEVNLRYFLQAQHTPSQTTSAQIRAKRSNIQIAKTKRQHDKKKSASFEGSPSKLCSGIVFIIFFVCVFAFVFLVRAS